LTRKDDEVISPLENFTICCPTCGSTMGNLLIYPSHTPSCCCVVLINEILKLRRSIIRHRRETNSEDGIAVSESDNTLYETIGLGKSCIIKDEFDEDFLDGEYNVHYLNK
jgi:hypothetical protein